MDKNMAKRGRKPKIQVDDLMTENDGPAKENFLELEEELLYHADPSEIERYVRPYRSSDSYGDSDEDSFAYWYGQN